MAGKKDLDKLKRRLKEIRNKRSELVEKLKKEKSYSEIRSQIDENNRIRRENMYRYSAIDDRLREIELLKMQKQREESLNYGENGKEQLELIYKKLDEEKNILQRMKSESVQKIGTVDRALNELGNKYKTELEGYLKEVKSLNEEMSNILQQLKMVEKRVDLYSGAKRSETLRNQLDKAGKSGTRIFGASEESFPDTAKALYDPTGHSIYLKNKQYLKDGKLSSDETVSVSHETQHSIQWDERVKARLAEKYKDKSREEIAVLAYGLTDDQRSRIVTEISTGKSAGEYVDERLKDEWDAQGTGYKVAEEISSSEEKRKYDSSKVNKQLDEWKKKAEALYRAKENLDYRKIKLFAPLKGKLFRPLEEFKERVNRTKLTSEQKNEWKELKKTLDESRKFAEKTLKAKAARKKQLEALENYRKVVLSLENFRKRYLLRSVEGSGYTAEEKEEYGKLLKASDLAVRKAVKNVIDELTDYSNEFNSSVKQNFTEVMQHLRSIKTDFDRAEYAKALEETRVLDKKFDRICEPIFRVVYELMNSGSYAEITELRRKATLAIKSVGGLIMGLDGDGSSTGKSDIRDTNELIKKLSNDIRKIYRRIRGVSMLNIAYGEVTILEAVVYRGLNETARYLRKAGVGFYGKPGVTLKVSRKVHEEIRKQLLKKMPDLNPELFKQLEEKEEEILEKAEKSE